MGPTRREKYLTLLTGNICDATHLASSIDGKYDAGPFTFSSAMGFLSGRAASGMELLETSERLYGPW